MYNNIATCCCAIDTSEVKIKKEDPDLFEEKPLPNDVNIGNFDVTNYGTVSDKTSTDHLLRIVAQRIQMRLRPNWICLTEGDGIHVMQLSRNFEKSVQRRIFFESSGAVHLSVHCVPLPITNFVPSPSMVQLQKVQDISDFVDAMETIVNVVRQLEICTGVSHEKYKPLWQSMRTAEVDKNPYQEARYSVTLRARKCHRLVRPRQRTCLTCTRLHDSLRLKANRHATGTVRGEGKK